MPPKSNTERIDELRDLATQAEIRLAHLERVAEQLGTVRRDLAEQIRAEVAQLSGLIAEQRKQLDDTRDRLTRLEQTVLDLKGRRDEWGRRGWGVVQTLIGAAVGGAIMYYARR